MTVTVAIYSGREDPAFDISSSVATELQSEIAELTFIENATLPSNLGFRGFILQSGEAEYCVRPGEVYVTTDDGTSVADSEGMYMILWEALSPRFDDDLSTEVPEP